MFIIETIQARQILDSRGNPTVEVGLRLQNGRGVYASVPSGASVGSREAVELRDGDPLYYSGKGVLKAVSNIHSIISPACIGRSFGSQRELDECLLQLDHTPTKSHLGANAILAVSMAFAKSMADIIDKPLYHVIGGSGALARMPIPMFNILNGGLHADNPIEIQEFMIVPHMPSIAENLEAAHRVFYNLKAILQRSGLSTNVGDEGGFAPNVPSTRAALDHIMEAIIASGFAPGVDISIALDVAANELLETDGRYHLRSESKIMDAATFVAYYTELVAQYPICSIEDPMAESDLEGWRIITQALGNKVHIVGDDIFVTNTKYLQIGIQNKIANALLVKMNQVGTITETLEAIELAHQHGYTTIVSHRSGETEDTTMAHLAVAVGSKYIKAGSICRTDRVCKYNELLRISETL